MAMQKPIVASNIGWAQEMIVDGQSGFLVHPKNHQEFADRINDLLTNNELRNEISLQARKSVVAGFDTKKIANQNLDFYRKVSSNFNKKPWS